MTAGFVVITVSAMEGEVEVVGGQEAKRMESSPMARQIVGHHVGSAQILEHSIQYCSGAVVREEAQGEIATAGSIRCSPQERAARRLSRRLARRLVLGSPRINGVEQRALIQHRLQGLACGVQADGVVPIREQNHDWPGSEAAMMGNEIGSKCQGVEQRSNAAAFHRQESADGVCSATTARAQDGRMEAIKRPAMRPSERSSKRQNGNTVTRDRLLLRHQL